MRIFVDTEFTSLSNPRLISAGAISERGDTFYGAVSDFPRRSCTRFVVEHVLPVLGAHRPDVQGTHGEVARAFRAWLEQCSSGDTEVLICADDECDLELVRQLTGQLAAHLRLVLLPISGDATIERRFAGYFEDMPDRYRHNAIDDARAYRAAIMSAERDANQGTRLKQP